MQKREQKVFFKKRQQKLKEKYNNKYFNLLLFIKAFLLPFFEKGKKYFKIQANLHMLLSVHN